MRQVYHLVDYKSALIGIRGHLAAMFLWYANQGFPDLCVEPEEFWKGGELNQKTWDDWIAKYLKTEHEVHALKVGLERAIAVFFF